MDTTIILALVIGAAFGFALDRVGATNPNFIVGMLRLSNLHLMKAIFLGIGVASFGMFGGILAGLIDVGHMDIKSAYMGVFVGGAIMGLGFALAGYCPGTGFAAIATGRWDAIFFVIGGLVGAFAYMITYADVKATGLLAEIYGGKATLGTVSGSKFPALFEGVPGEWIGMALGAVFVLIAVLLPASLRGGSEKASDRRHPGSAASYR